MRSFYGFYMLLEGRAESMVGENPRLRVAYDAGIKNPNLLGWVLGVSAREPVEDVVPVVLAFEKNRQRLAQKDINAYKTAGQLRLAIEGLGASGKERDAKLKEEETTKIGEFGGWVVIMPHTRESSCQWGKGTTWCTAATQSGNLFLNYVGRSDGNTILYYLMKRGVNPTEHPNAKISIGFVDGKPVMDGEYGGLTVNADNEGMDESSLAGVLGENYRAIMSALKEHSRSLGGEHPAKRQMKEIAASKDPSVFEKYASGMKPEEKEDLIEVLMGYGLSNEMISSLLASGSASAGELLNGVARSGDLKMAEVLTKSLENSHEPNRRNFFLGRALVAATWAGKLEMANFLIEKGATALGEALSAAWESKRFEIMKMLLDRGAKGLEVENIFTKAVVAGDSKTASLFMKNLENPDRAIIVAAGNGNLEAVKFFADKVDIKNLNYAAMSAAKYGFLPMVEFIVGKTGNFEDALMGAAQGRNSEVVRFLLEKGGEKISENDLYKAFRIAFNKEVQKILGDEMQKRRWRREENHDK
jgi:hypothetical protein